jgi:predicted NBD/HSP70 family sugar kinase
MSKIREPNLHTLRLLSLVYQHSRLSRSDLAQRTGYSNFLVSKLMDRLLAQGYVTEVGSGDSTGGRRPTLLAISPGLGRVVGLHVGTINARIVVTDIAGSVLTFLNSPSRVEEGPKVALPHLIGLVGEALGLARVKRKELLGIGIGISGILDRASGTTLMWPKVPQWKDVPIRKILSEHFPVALEVEDTPRTMALAERRLGQARAADEFIYLMIGAGIGSALFLRGELYTGRGGFAGEFGHVTVEESGPMCDCGNRGCLETLVSASALIQRAREAVSQGSNSLLWKLSEGDPRNISVERIVQAADEGDRFSARLLNEAGTYLGKATVNLLHLLNPELVVLGGGLMRAAGRLLLPTIQRVVQERALPQAAQSLRLELSQLQEQDWAVGASLLVTERVLRSLFLSVEEQLPSESSRRQRKATHLPVV